MRDTAGILNEAYQLIEAGNLGEARQRLQPLLANDSQNPDVWWLYAHAVEDPTEGQQALERVLELSPSYPGAADLLAQTSPMPSDAAPPKPQTPLRPLTPLAPVLPESTKQVAPTGTGDFDDDFGDTQPEEARRRSPLMLVALLLLALVVVGVILLLAMQPGTGGTATPTAVAQGVTPLPVTDAQSILLPTEDLIPTDVAAVATEEMVSTDAIIATEDSTTTEEPAPTVEEAAPLATSDVVPAATAEAPIPTVDSQSVETTDLTALSTALAALNVPADSVQIRQTTLGATALVDACEIPGPIAGSLITALMDNLARFTGYGSDTEAIGVSVADCASGSAARIVAVALADAAAYNSGDIDAREFQRRWQPVDALP
jgi:hypothetical protein